MKTAIAATAVLMWSATACTALHAQSTITRDHIDYFLEVAFSSDNDRLPGWSQPARVRIAPASVVKSDSDLKEIIAELNRIAGRTLLLLSDSSADVEVHYVTPAHFAHVDRSLRSGWSHSEFQQADSGRIESGAVFLSRELSGEAKRGALRRNLAQVVGLMYGSRRHSRSLFYDGSTMHSALVFEPVDRAIIRILGENGELRGMSKQGVRERLVRRYLQ